MGHTALTTTAWIVDSWCYIQLQYRLAGQAEIHDIHVGNSQLFTLLAIFIVIIAYHVSQQVPLICIAMATIRNGGGGCHNGKQWAT